VKWKTLADVEVPDIVQFVKAAAAAGQAVHVGTDSLQTGRYTQFVTVVAVLTPSKGGRALYSREIVPRMTSLRERLMKEVWRSVELGMQLAPVLPDHVELNIHVDANPDERYMSSKYVQELVGLVVGQGFRALIKPDSWAATHAADHIVRVKGKTPRHLRVVGGRKAS
jgi:hypothetical protein